MRSFTCETCQQLIFFQNDRCLHCHASLALRPSTRQIEVVGDGDVRCNLHATIGCNWLVEDGEELCRACRQTRMTPPLEEPSTVSAHRQAELAKRRVLFQLLDLGLPIDVAVFDMKSSKVDDAVMIGHEAGIVTIDVDETDDARREKARDQLSEPYRTVVGHIRHELGHALFTTLVPEARLQDVRAVFGNEEDDYQPALDRHYAEGPPAGWRENHVSAYATMHPAEDWAETFAHVLHITDTLETADAYGLRLDPRALDVWTSAILEAGRTPVRPESDAGSLRARVDVWLPLTYALNAVNRSMGDTDLYPFVLTDAVIDKLDLVDRLVRRVA